MAFPSAADFQFADDADFFDLFGLDDADFSFISYTQMRPIRSDLRRLFANVCGSPCRGQKPKGLAESAYATELRLFDA